MVERIDTLTRRANAASVVIDLVAIGLTVLAAALAIRVVRRYERSLRDRAEDLELFAGRVAHDVKGPLTATGLALHIARKASTGKVIEVLDGGQRSLRRVQRLVDDLLEFSRAGAAVDAGGAAADVHAVVEDVAGELRALADEHGIELSLEAAPVRIACSPGVLTSVVSNLVRNAITHMGASKRRVVWVRAARLGEDGPARIEVEDTGPGIPVGLGERAFEPFVRGAEPEVGGTGLGLATVKRFVTGHGGRVGFRNRAGGGTLFWVELPRAPGAPGEGGREPMSAARS